jgi:hypothetical protein
MRLPSRAIRLAATVSLVALVALPAHSAEGPREPQKGLLSHLSQVVQARYLLAHPDAADEGGVKIADTLTTTGPSGATATGATGPSPTGSTGSTPIGLGPPIIQDVFNRDTTGLPQNEEAVTVCQDRPQYVLSGANDYRGLLDPEGNFTGWYFSQDGGQTVSNEGLLPSLAIGDANVPSGGDPVVQSDEECNLYAASLNYIDPSEGDNGIGLYRTTPETLASCPQGQDPDQLTHPECWPEGRIVAQATVAGGVGSFLDKEWFDVGQSGEAGNVIWLVYSDFAQDVNAPLGFTGAQIKAVRCSADLSECTDPILISGEDQDVQFADVTIAEDGSTLITWVQIEGELEQTAQTFTVKARIAEPGSTEFGPTEVVAAEQNPMPFGGFLHANDFRTASYPKSIMPIVDGERTPYVVWDRCRYRLQDTICEEPQIRMSSSPDGGTTWTKPRTISAGGDNYFPAISDEVGNPNFVVAYFTNRFDNIFHNRQAVEMVTVDNATGHVVRRQRVATKPRNESEADPILGGFFIGDYIDVHLLGGTAYVAYNANYRRIQLLGEGVAVPQQDNYLTTLSP